MDTGAGISVIDLETVRHLGLESYITQSQTVQNIYEVSGSNIKVIGNIEVSVKLGSVMCTHIIRVIESKTRNIILGRDFMSKFKQTVFNWEKDEIILDGKIIKGLDIKEQEQVKVLSGQTILPQQEIIAQCSKKIAYLQSDFEPTKIVPGISGVNTCKAKVDVNHEGAFNSMMVNTTEIPVYIQKKLLVGKIYPPSQVLWCSTGGPCINVDNFGTENMVPNIENLSLGENLSASQKEEIVESLSKFPEVFA